MSSTITRNIARLIPAIALALTAAAPAGAAVIVRYEFPVSNSVVNPAPTTLEPGFTATSVTAPAGVDVEGQAVPGNAGFSFSTTLGNNGGGISDIGEDTVDTVAEALASDDYFEFTITPNGGNSFDPVDLSFQARKGGTGTRVAFARVSLDGTTFTTVGTASSIPENSFQTSTFSLAGVSDVTAAAPLTVRIYSYTGQNSRNIRFDNLEVTGNVTPIPEPASVALAAVGLLGLLGRRHRR